MRAVTPRRVILVFLALTVALGCIVPSVFHDRYGQGQFSCSRNRLTGEVSIRVFIPWHSCLDRRPRSVFGDD